MQYLSATYNLWGVVASVLIASFASYVTLDLAKRVHLAEGGMAVLWWAGGSLAMGTGIWSMHFIGMLAFTLPIPLGYTGALTLLSWLAAVGASSVALWTAVHGVLSWKRLIGGALAMGAAICAMHYTGMAGLDMSPGIVWNPWLVAASAVVAVAAAAAALRIFFWLRGVSERRSVAYQVAAAVLMGLAISGMHYTGMAAAGFPAGAVCLSADALSGDALGYLVVLGSVTMLALTLFTSSVDARAQRNQRAASRLSAANAQLEAAGREVRARLEAVFEHAPNGYILFDRQRGIGQCNPAAVKLFAAPGAESLSGRALWLAPLSPPNQADGRTSEEAAQAHLEQQLRSGDRVLSFEWRFCRFDGSLFEALVSVIALEWQAELEFCAVIEDVTARKQAETTLQHARDAAEAASQTKSNFLANMSHELRTPMNAIIGLTHLVLEDGLPAKQRDYVEKAHHAARDLLQILNDILDISKIEAGHVELERIEFDLESVIDEMSDLLGLKASEHGLELLFSAAPDLPTRLIGDPLRLRQVLVNLGSNAIKFTDTGEVTVGMELLSQDADSVELHGWVRDTGVGMTEEQLNRVFRPFIQADSSTTRRFGGTGLGLSIARQLVESMGGRLWADSEPDKGSTFHFSARFGRGAPRAPSPRGLSADQLRGRRALLVDDNAAALEVLGRMLEGLGITVDRAAGGDHALRLIDERPTDYSWVLLDWKMPGMDGVTCARRMLARHPQARPCILLVTAFGRDDALRASAGLRLAGVLQKPVTPSSLFDCLVRVGVAGPPPAPARAAATAIGQEARRRLAGARVLLVEDHPVNRELALELLRRAGVQVLTAENGQEALQRLAQDGPFDGVLMDCQMPVMDGYTATRQLRAHPAWRDLPVIAMTASALAADRDRALACGMNAHISKPLDVEQMWRTMADWIAPAEPLTRRERGDAAPAVDGDSDASVIDAVDGLARCSGDMALYRRALRGFRDALSELRAGLHLTDPPPAADAMAHRMHDLQGLAGTVGARLLQAAARDLHRALALGDHDATHAGRARVDAAGRDALREVDRMLAKDAPAP